MNKIAAIWARVSTPLQTSLPDQIARVKEKLEKEGYTVPPDRILAVDWTSLDLFSNLEFQKLRRWIRNKEIAALGILDRDRLQAQGLQRLLFLSECRDAGVNLVLCQGTDILDEPEGQLLELALAIGKERSVMRAGQGAKDGLHDKVMRDRKPTSHHRVFGFKWDTDTKLVPNEEWGVVKQIFKMVLSGTPYLRICKELEKRGIPSPKGHIKWVRSTLSAIINNPIYAGKYYALKTEVKQPKNRRENTYGNSSHHRKPLEERVYLHEVEIVNPPITWEQYQQILEQLKKNQELAKRNAKHDYLLRGFIPCGTHVGKSGKPLHYYGQPWGKKHVYKCPIGGCAYPILDGELLEHNVKELTKSLIGRPPHMFSKYFNNEEARLDLEREIRDVEMNLNKNIREENELVRLRTRGKITDEAYDSQWRSITGLRDVLKERKKVIEDEIGQLNRQAEAVDTLKQIKDTIANDFESLSNDKWRQLFKTLNLAIHVLDKVQPPRYWKDPLPLGWQGLPIEYCPAEISFGIEIVPDKEVADIVFTTPGSNST